MPALWVAAKWAAGIGIGVYAAGRAGDALGDQVGKAAAVLLLVGTVYAVWSANK